MGWFANWSWCVVLTVVACYKMLRVGALLVFVRFRFRWWFGLQRVTLVLVVCCHLCGWFVCSSWLSNGV